MYSLFLSRFLGFFFLFGFLVSPFLYTEQKKDKTVFIAILARNKAHTLPRFLKCLENQDYPKSLISLYINTNNNCDETEKILTSWVQNHKQNYQSVLYDSHTVDQTLSSNPHDWNTTKFKVLASIRNKSLKLAQELQTDYYFVVDCDNFIAPFTLSDLIQKDKPIIAPLLRSIPDYPNPYANFFCDVDENGYYKPHPLYEKILFRSIIGTFKVPVVHCTYLIQSSYLDQLGYSDGTNDYEFVIFSRLARKNQVDQYICNEKEYGTLVHFLTPVTLEEEKNRLQVLLTLP